MRNGRPLHLMMVLPKTKNSKFQTTAESLTVKAMMSL